MRRIGPETHSATGSRLIKGLTIAVIERSARRRRFVKPIRLIFIITWPNREVLGDRAALMRMRGIRSVCERGVNPANHALHMLLMCVAGIGGGETARAQRKTTAENCE